MYTKEQEEIALREYERLGSIAAVIHQLGYPSESTLYRWYERKKAGLENRHGCISETPTTTYHHCNTPGHPRHPSAELKYEVLHRSESEELEKLRTQLQELQFEVDVLKGDHRSLKKIPASI